jgi:hypothetical protein
MHFPRLDHVVTIARPMDEDKLRQLNPFGNAVIEHHKGASFRDDVFKWIDRTLATGREEIRISIEHAQLLGDVTTSAVVRRWTVIVGIGSVLILLLTIASVAISVALLRRG